MVIGSQRECTAKDALDLACLYSHSECGVEMCSQLMVRRVRFYIEKVEGAERTNRS